MIVTDATGQPIPGRPESLKPNATYREWRDWVRAERAWRDKVTDLANASFTTAFAEGIRS